MARTGRPKEYNEDTVKKAQQYLDECVDTYTVTKEGEEGTLKKVNIPSIAGLALYLNIARETVYDWRDKYPEFSDILGHILAEQERRLISNGLSGAYNSNITKLVLGKHGYHDKQDTDITTKGEKIENTDEIKELSKKFTDFIKQDK